MKLAFEGLLMLIILASAIFFVGIPLAKLVRLMIPPISCYCRKPMNGRGVWFINKHKLKAKECIMVGDMTTDKTFATRSGFQYVDQAEFFK